MSWALERRPPRKLYLLLDDQPPRMMRVDRQAADGEDEDDADVDVRGDDELVGVVVLAGRRLLIGLLDFSGARLRSAARGRAAACVGRAERHDGEGQQGGADGDGRGEQEEELIDVRGDDVFLEEELEPSAIGCSRPARPDAVGAEAVLHVGRDLALQ